MGRAYFPWYSLSGKITSTLLMNMHAAILPSVAKRFQSLYLERLWVTLPRQTKGKQSPLPARVPFTGTLTSLCELFIPVGWGLLVAASAVSVPVGRLNITYGHSVPKDGSRVNVCLWPVALSTYPTASFQLQ
eukprot:665893-Amphidinium_carterae.1